MYLETNASDHQNFFLACLTWLPLKYLSNRDKMEKDKYRKIKATNMTQVENKK